MGPILAGIGIGFAICGAVFHIGDFFLLAVILFLAAVFFE